MKLITKFQDEDFELGETAEVSVSSLFDNTTIKVHAKSLKNGAYYSYFYKSVKDFTDHWEDASEESEKHYFIDNAGNVKDEKGHSHYRKQRQEIGNDFASEEEAKRALEKLKARQRLIKKGFRFQGWEDLEAIELPIKHFNNIIGFKLEDNHDVIADLNTLFGGEE